MKFILNSGTKRKLSGCMIWEIIDCTLMQVECLISSVWKLWLGSIFSSQTLYLKCCLRLHFCLECQYLFNAVIVCKEKHEGRPTYIHLTCIYYTVKTTQQIHVFSSISCAAKSYGNTRLWLPFSTCKRETWERRDWQTIFSVFLSFLWVIINSPSLIDLILWLVYRKKCCLCLSQA